MLAVDEVPRGFLEALVDVRVARYASDVDWLHRAAADQAQRRVAGGRDEVVTALRHQRDHLVGRAGRLDVDLAARVFLEWRYPVVTLVGFAALDVARPGDDIDLAFERFCSGRRCGVGRGGRSRLFFLRASGDCTRDGQGKQ